MAAMSTINIQAIHIHVTDHHHYADALDFPAVDHSADAFDPEAAEQDIDPPMPDEEPEHSGLDPQQEIAAAIAAAVMGRVGTGRSGDIITRSWIETITEAILRDAEDRATAGGISLF